MAKPSLNISTTGSIVNNTVKKMSDTSNNKSSNNKSNDPEVVEVKVSKPNIAKLAAEALNTTASLVEKIDTEETKDAAEIMRKSAKVAETIPVAVAGIKKEAEPAVKSIKNLWNALEEKGIVGVRDKVNIAEMRKK